MLDILWGLIFEDRFWEIIIPVLIIIVTDYLATKRAILLSKRKSLSDAISNLQMTGYLLEKAAYNRYEAEIFSNFYDGVRRINNDQTMYEEYKKHVLALPELGNKMYIQYGKAFKYINIIKQNISKKEYERLEKVVQEIIGYKTLLIETPNYKEIKTMSELEKYKEDAVQAVKKRLIVMIKDPFVSLIQKLH